MISGARGLSRSQIGLVQIVISAAAFGVMPVLAKLAYAEGVNLKTLLSLRFCLAAAAMWLVWGLQRRDKGASLCSMSLVVPLFLMGAIGYVGQSFAYFTAVTIISASATSLLLYTYPTLVAILAWLIYREAFTRRKVLALVVASAGTLMVLGLLAPLLGFGNSALGELRPEGVAWAAAASIIYSAYIIAGTRFTAGIAPIFASAVIISTAAAVYTVWGSLTGELHYNLTALGWVWAGAIALISTVIAITLFFAGLARVGPSRAAIASTIEPAVTVLLAAVVLGEAINLEQGVGGGLILASVIILQYRARKVTPE